MASPFVFTTCCVNLFDSSSTGYYSSFVSAIDAFGDCVLMHLYCIIANYFNL